MCLGRAADTVAGARRDAQPDARPEDARAGSASLRGRERMDAVPDDALPFSPVEFDAIYSRVPRLTVEIIVPDGQGAVFLTKRAIAPFAGQWHLPGGTVYFAEPLLDA